MVEWTNKHKPILIRALPFSLSLEQSLSHSHSLTLTLSLSHSLSHSLSLCLSLSLSQSLTHSHFLFACPFSQPLDGVDERGRGGGQPPRHGQEDTHTHTWTQRFPHSHALTLVRIHSLTCRSSGCASRTRTPAPSTSTRRAWPRRRRATSRSCDGSGAWDA